jgi:hypothetical protein
MKGGRGLGFIAKYVKIYEKEYEKAICLLHRNTKNA